MKSVSGRLFAYIAICMLLLGTIITLTALIFKSEVPRIAAGGVKTSITPTNHIITGKIGAVQVLPDTVIIRTYSFLCGHNIVRSSSGEYIGFDKSKLENEIENGEVTSMNSGTVCITVNCMSYCPKHYLLAIKGNELTVFKTGKIYLQTEEVMRLDTDIDKLPEAAKLLLTKGVVFDTLEQINSYLEDFD